MKNLGINNFYIILVVEEAAKPTDLIFWFIFIFTVWQEVSEAENLKAKGWY